MNDFDRIEAHREHNESFAYEEWADRLSARDEIGPEDPGASPPLGDDPLVTGDAPGSNLEEAA